MQKAHSSWRTVFPPLSCSDWLLGPYGPLPIGERKYYIDVQRKEDSFDLSGASRNEAESSSFYMTCEISLEEIKKPDCASPQKRKEAKNIQRLDHYCKQHTPPLVISPDPHEYEAKSIDVFCFKSTWETNKLEESNADFIQEDSRNDYGKRDKKVQDAVSNVHTRDIILTDPCDWQMAHIPQKAQCCCTCAEQQCNFISETSDEEQDSFSDSSVTVTSILGALENEQSEEFSVSSVSDSLSLRSLSDVHEQMEENNCVDRKGGGKLWLQPRPS
ncbi:uncharacterized protein LOC119862281 isoform X2 [Dermochelys coriacea]|uniref:uncharacterized protein LOC119862281 isoform X2 n=1 Tax=Dermochelys coriacea TaxID=27794 RepID=UPI001CA95DE1|nr:uncharacterized protein LOC119862281 isoform X2 [Dermochelys coriacea]